MDADPTTNESVNQFIKVTHILHEMGVKAPEIFAEDVDNGLLLLEDLGDQILGKILSNQFFNEIEFYRNTVNVLIHIYKNSGKVFDLPEYDKTTLLKEAKLFTKWYTPLYEDGNGESEEFDSIISKLIDNLKYPNKILVLRDFHAENLIYKDDEKEKIKQIAVIDYQDALIGNPAYDLLSLLEDARRDISKYLAEDMIKYFIFQIGEVDNKEDFLHDYYILAAIRNLKILGVFCRLKIRDGKDNYIKFLPRVKKHLIGDLKHEALSELKR